MNLKCFFSLAMYIVFLAGCSNPTIEIFPPQHQLSPTEKDVQLRMRIDSNDNRPIVAHVIVALCDKTNQWIKGVNSNIGDGNDPQNNLYWGSMDGVKKYFKNNGWKIISLAESNFPENVLDRTIFQKTINSRNVFVVADAWKGARIANAIEFFLNIAGGNNVQNIRCQYNNKEILLSAGGKSHVVAYVGHNGLMDPTFLGYNPKLTNMKMKNITPSEKNPPKSSIVLACESKKYFINKLKKLGSFPLLLTNGKMFPAASILDISLNVWCFGKSEKDVINAAAEAYYQNQKQYGTTLNSAKKLFKK